MDLPINVAKKRKLKSVKNILPLSQLKENN